MSDAASTTSARNPTAPRPTPEAVRLWIGVLLPPASWVVDFMTRYMLIRFASVHDQRWLLRVPTLLCLGLLLIGAWLCAKAHRQARRRAAESSADSSATLAAWGLALAGYFLLLMLAETLPSFVVGVREIT